MNRWRRGDLFAGRTAPETGEAFEPLVDSPAAHIERIVSSAAPDPSWYDQDHDEWVLLLSGSARLEIEDDAGTSEVALSAGQWLWLPAHVRHRVAATSPGATWVAIHLKGTRAEDS